MLSERFGVTVQAVKDELADLEKRYKANRKPLLSQMRMLKDREAGQKTLVSFSPLPEHITIPATETALESLKGIYQTHKRHLTALLRVLEDEVSTVAAAQQPELPLDGAA